MLLVSEAIHKNALIGDGNAARERVDTSKNVLAWTPIVATADRPRAALDNERVGISADSVLALKREGGL